MAVTNTTLSFGMLSVPIGLDKIAEKREPSFDRATKNGNAIERIERDAVTAEVVGEDFPAVKGVFEDPKSKTGFREIAAELIKEIEEATKLDAFEIEAFVPLADIPFERAVGCYYIKPQKGVNPKPLRILYDALKASEKAGVFKLTLRSRQQPAVVYAKNGGLYVNTLLFAEDFKKAEHVGDVLADVKAEPQMVALAVDLIENMSAGVEALDSMTDDVRPLREKLVADALAGKKVTAPAKAKAKAAPAEDALMAALKASVKQSGEKKKIAA